VRREGLGYTRAQEERVLVSSALILASTVALAADHEALPVEVENLDPAPATRVAPPVPYPGVAVKLGRTDDCRMHVSIDKKGRPLSATPVACDSLFELGAGVALRQWTWEPWLVDGKKVPHEFDVMVHYRLADGPKDPDASGTAPRSFGRPDEGGAADEVEAIGPGDPIILGSLDRSLIVAVVNRSLPKIRYCFQRRLADAPSLRGKVVVKFVIAKDGTVSSANIKSTTLGDASVEDCVAARFITMQFPEPVGGGIVIVSYPFAFGPE
jgi:hypothetical protein